jgi:hypothetical protein
VVPPIGPFYQRPFQGDNRTSPLPRGGTVSFGANGRPWWMMACDGDDGPCDG